MCNDLGLSSLFELANSIYTKCKKVISTAFDISACVILSVKLKYAESDEIVAYIESHINTDNYAWM